MTIQDILQKVDLFNFTAEEGLEKIRKDTKDSATDNSNDSHEEKAQISNAAPSSAYLGPKLWNNPISLPDIMDDDEPSDVMNMEEFLAENNLTFNFDPQQTPSSPQMFSAPVSPPVIDVKPQTRPSIIVAPKRPLETGGRMALPKGENNFLYAESKRAKMEREKEERRKKFEIEMDFAPEDLALATVPGMDFDPKERAFDLEELRPQPIIRKRKKTAVPEEMKDEKYWEKRIKNKVATRRSREARRLKENQIALRAAFLEKENATMKQALESSQFEKTKISMEIEILKQKLAQYEA